ncbi:hypothetical protein Gotur_027358 [Gossypium turneri]
MTSAIQHVKLQRMGKENVRNYHQMKSEHANACMNAVATPTETENRGRKIKNAVLELDHVIDRGKWITGYSRNIGIFSVFDAKLRAIMDCLDITWRRGIKQMLVEFDCG